MSSTDPNVTQAVTQLLSRQHQHPTALPGAIDNLQCQWLGCSERAETPEHLYDHVCEKHVGRKSTNNLNLQCHWGTCRTTTVKRDHITSHIRVHVPLKPHKCDFCGKSFKRPQDLKKHVKTHADDSVLMRSPESGMPRGPGQMDGYQPSQAKGSAMYGSVPTGQYGGYMHQSNGYDQHQGGMQHHTYGNGAMMQQGFNQAAGFGDQGLTETRKRTHDALDSFFGAIKQRRVDPFNYLDLNAQFGGPEALPFNMGLYQTGYNAGGYGGATDRDFGGGATAYAQSRPIHQLGNPYGVPFESLKSREDLINVDRFLERLQETAYDFQAHAVNRATIPVASSYNMAMNDSVGGATQGGLPQAGMVDPQISDSPPTLPSVGDSTDVSDTPALTPNSQASRGSPTSTHSAQMHSSNDLYPSLTSMNGHADTARMSSQHRHNGAGAPPSGLGNEYEDVEARRRFSGGYLHRARPGVANPQDEIKRELQRDTKEVTSEKDHESAISTTPTIDVSPKAGSASPKSTTSSEKEAFLESWVQNMRVLESIREYVKARLDNNVFEDGTAGEDADGATTPKANGHGLRQDADGDSEMKDGGQAHSNGIKHEAAAKDSLYPVLRDSAEVA